MSRVRIVLIFLLLTCLLPANQSASLNDVGLQSQDVKVQERPPSGQSTTAQEENQEDAVVRVDTTLVSVPVSVFDRDGRFVSSLQREDFRVFEDGIEQEIAYFATVELPFSVVLLIDISTSTGPRQKEIREAAVAFIDQLRPHDNVMVVAFDTRIQVIGKAAKDRASLRKAILDLKWEGRGTLLYGAVDAVVNHFLINLKGRKALVLLTDGQDSDVRRLQHNWPKRDSVTIYGPSCREIPCATYESNIRDVDEAEVLIYPVKFEGEPNPPQKSKHGILEGKMLAEEYLNELARKTGGRFYDAGEEGSLMQTFNSIAGELRNQYSLGFYAKESAQPGQRRELKVRVSRSGLAVRARSSYIYKRKAKD